MESAGLNVRVMKRCYKWWMKEDSNKNNQKSVEEMDGPDIEWKFYHKNYNRWKNGRGKDERKTSSDG